MPEDVFSTYYLERFTLGELPGEIEAQIRRKAEKDPDLRDRIENLRSSNQEILTRYSPAQTASEISAKLEPAPSRVSGMRRLLILSTAAAALLIFVYILLPTFRRGLPVQSGIDSPAGEPAGNLLVKGDQDIDPTQTQLIIYRKHEDAVQLMEPSDRAAEGDLLQLAYISTEDSHGVILSIDGRGVVSLHFPSGRGQPTLLEQNRKILLPNAIELDDAPDYERFFLITSPSPLDVPDILEIAAKLASGPERANGKLELPEGISQYSFMVRKGDGR